ncbi:hypothetical protein RRG08_016266 [Elysia crispata]|uniref:Uncharacterized protein n=1 Tax=Elysia crispata TaxID=231223 RepID=A0AAE1AL10_9GAST|nr:hypothetical protein RRG08_016266 [Elysia crispata]
MLSPTIKHLRYSSLKTSQSSTLYLNTMRSSTLTLLFVFALTLTLTSSVSTGADIESKAPVQDKDRICMVVGFMRSQLGCGTKSRVCQILNGIYKRRNCGANARG